MGERMGEACAPYSTQNTNHRGTNKATEGERTTARGRERERERARERETFCRLHLREIGGTQGAEHEEAGLGQPVAVVLGGEGGDRPLLRLLGRAEQRGSLQK